MFAHVIPAKRGKRSLPFFEYSVPPEIEKNISAGHIVKIPLRASEEFGVVKSLHATPEGERLKPLKDIVGSAPFISSGQLAFLEELSLLYRASLGFLIKNNLPELGKRRLSKFKEVALPVFPADNLSKSTKPTLATYRNYDDKKVLFNRLVADPGQTLVIVPEIPDIEAAAKIFDHDDKHVVVITSKLSARDIYERMLSVRSGEKKIIIGTRRAFFLPFFNLRAVIIDDDASPSNKSWDMAPRFHNRDAALLLTKHHGAELYITGHTPAVETYYFAKKEVYRLSGDLIPHLRQDATLINMKEERHGGNYSIISDELAAALTKTSGSIFLFLNRRGSLNYIACRDCGEISICPTCRRSLTYHRSTATLDCHYCKYRRPMIPNCPKCHGTNLAMYGAGTELVEQEIKKYFPAEKRAIIRIEGDEKSLRHLNTSEKQIIIGTQLVWHHLDWSKLELVALLDADTSLFVPEFKMAENAWHTLRDAVYRTTPSAILFIQTNHPEHIVFRALTEPELFYTQELTQRKMFLYPPYNFLLKMFSGHEEENYIKREANELYRALLELTKSNPDIKITANLEMFPPFYQGKHWQVIIAKLNYKNYKSNTKRILNKLPESWKIDLNPNTILSLA